VNGDFKAGKPDFWWGFLDTVLRARLFPLAEPAAWLRDRLTRDLQDGNVPEELLDILEEHWRAFEHGDQPREFLSAIAQGYRVEADRLFPAHEKDALWCREVALLADHLLSTLGAGG
jgi:hypothetical protein